MDAPFYERKSDCVTVLVDAFLGALMYLVFFFLFSLSYFPSLNFTLPMNSATSLPPFWLNCRRILSLEEETWKTASPCTSTASCSLTVEAFYFWTVHYQLLPQHFFPPSFRYLSCTPKPDSIFFRARMSWMWIETQLLLFRQPFWMTHCFIISHRTNRHYWLWLRGATCHDMSILDLNWNVPSFWNAQHKTAPLSGHSCSRWMSFHAAIYKFTSHPDLHTQSSVLKKSDTYRWHD